MFDLASLDLHTMGIVVVSYTIKVTKVIMSKIHFVQFLDALASLAFKLSVSE